MERKRDPAFLRAALAGDARVGGLDVVDDGTWQDLNLDLVYGFVDRTLSTPGEVSLYRMLRAPLEDALAVRERAARIQRLQDDAEGRRALLLELTSLGRADDGHGVLEWVRGGVLSSGPRVAAVHRLLAIVAAALLATALLAGGGAWVAVFGAFAVNMGLHYGTRAGIERHFGALRYLGRLIRSGRRLARVGPAAFDDVRPVLARRASELSRVSTTTAALILDRGGVFDAFEVVYEYVCIFFLVETRAYFAVLDELRTRRGALQELFEIVGDLDAFQSAASLRAGLRAYCQPEFATPEAMLRIEGARHPLLENAVPNSLAVSGRGCIITGSNMSGKSTFLRTLGVNALLAQAFGTCTATSYRAPLFRICSSISPADELTAGKSFFFAEAERLLLMIRKAAGPAPALCLVDEVLRGTNSVERLAASREILAYLARQRAVVVVATHDMELVERLDGAYDGYHFSDQADGAGLRFDYSLRPGATPTRNAIRLLRQMGFPDAIVAPAWRSAFGTDAPPEGALALEADPPPAARSSAEAVLPSS